MKQEQIPLNNLLAEIAQCTVCAGKIPQPNPVVRANTSAKILIIGQAPGSKVHASSVPWDDASGKRLRQWLHMDETQFYDQSLVAIIPMGFCYPGKGKSGDLPPRPECAAKWHERLLELLPNIQLTLLIGMYAQQQYSDSPYQTLTERVRHWPDYAPQKFLLPHPSPRNQFWLKKNPWFELETIPALQKAVARC